MYNFLATSHVLVQILKAYYEYLSTVGTLLGGEKNHTRKSMLEVIELEMQIAQITLPLEKMRDEEKNYNRLTVHKLQVS